ncbi:ABC transporter substrate-binding protein [Bombiscardovia apis]|uniref:ABC transporter substrate-binding protein n=1 Tax=Bombiscardovia apis TaxID=2932182 RepID=A0ABN6SJV8_9BIFI|nr:zinc ABC transporter substrate-binding protein [Bombiscardovia apis]BDR55010.1 ABC transporter substrate-binding protein [Bombiscardovia apis]
MSSRQQTKKTHKLTTRVRAATAGALAFVSILALSACSGADFGQEKANGPITVVSSIGQWASLSRQLGGDKVKSQAVISNPNAEAHDYEPTTSDIGLIGRAEMVVVNGADYDAWASKAAEDNDRYMINVASLSKHKSGDNPHLWFSQQARVQAAKAITKTYQDLRPDEADYFAQRYDEWHQQEEKLNDQLHRIGQQVKATRFVATESAADYLAQDLQLVDATPTGFSQAIANESEPSPADIHQFELLLSSGEAKLLVFNDQEASAVSDQLVAAAERSSVPIVKVSEQMPARYQDLADWIGDLANSFARALQVDVEPVQVH